ncbi:MAG: UbiA prenyltransferase family protein [Kiritimatiellae bacterium]|nr:UbiA prenyltransferase family protein [Kiritimatiellia bacterium]
MSLRIVRMWLRELRIHQWTKNALIPAAWFFALSDPSQRAMAHGWRPVLLMLGMTGSFCLVSSAFYLFNDVKDRASDRMHPVKRHRPVAAGLISPSRALAVSAACFVLGFVPSAVMFCRHVDRWPMLAVVMAYSLMQLAYSGGLKKIPYLDVVVIAAGFVLRAMAGTTVLDVRLSPWLLACAFSLSLFLAICKRRHEKLVCESSRPSLAGCRLPTLDTLVAASAMTTLAIYVAYTLVPATVSRHACGHRLAVTAIPVALGLVRYLQLTYSLADVGRPEKIVMTDRILWLAAALYAASAVLALAWR